jgi:hypothetical protein
MKILDKKNGKLAGVNIIDAFVVLLLIFLVFSFTSKILNDDLTFSGDEMYNAIQGYNKLESKGFLVEAMVEGKWIVDETDFNEQGLIINTQSGGLLLKTDKGDKLWIGGSMAYIEDIAANKITFKIKDNYVIILPLESMEFSGYDSFINYLEDKKKFVGADNLRIGSSTSSYADVSFINPVMSTQEIFNEFGDTYNIKSCQILEFGKDESIFRFKLADLEELKKVTIEAEKVVISKTYFYAGYADKPELDISSDEYHVVSLEDIL